MINARQTARRPGVHGAGSTVRSVAEKRRSEAPGAPIDAPYVSPLARIRGPITGVTMAAAALGAQAGGALADGCGPGVFATELGLRGGYSETLSGSGCTPIDMSTPISVVQPDGSTLAFTTEAPRREVRTEESPRRPILDRGAAALARGMLTRTAEVRRTEAAEEVRLPQRKQTSKADLRRVFGSRASEVEALLKKRETQSMSRAEFSRLEHLTIAAGTDVSSTVEERISAVIGALPYDHARASDNSTLGTFTPFETLQNSGVCRDLHTLAAYYAHRAGLRVMLIGAGEDDILHRFTFIETSTGSLLDYGYLTDMENFADAMPGAQAFRRYSVPGHMDERSTILGTTMTESGGRLADAIDGFEMLGGRSVGVTAQPDHVGAKFKLHPRVTAEVHSFRGAGSALEHADFGVLRFSVSDNMKISVGGGKFRDVPWRTVGSRVLNHSDITAGFVGLESSGRYVPYEKTLANGATIGFELPYELNGRAVYAVNEEGDNALGFADGLNHLELEARPALFFRNKGLEGELGIFVGADLATVRHIKSEGFEKIGDLPLNYGPFLSVDWSGPGIGGNDFGVSLELEHNIPGPRTDGSAPGRIRGLVAHEVIRDVGDVAVGLEFPYGDALDGIESDPSWVATTSFRRGPLDFYAGAAGNEHDRRVLVGVNYRF